MLKGNKASAVIFSILFALIIALSVVLGMFKDNIVPPVDTTSGVTSSENTTSIEDVSDATSSDNSSFVPSDDYILPTSKTDTTSVEFNAPEELRAVFLEAGVDFAKKPTDTETRIRADIDSAFQSAKAMSLNTILFDTLLEGEAVVYNDANLPMYMEDFDMLDYAVKKAREYDMYLYAVISPSLTVDENGKLVNSFSTSPQALAETKRQFEFLAETYAVDAIVINNYYYEEYDVAYSDYVLYGNHIGFENFKHYAVEKNIETAAKTIRNTNNDILVVLYADGIWKNQSTDPTGSLTTAPFESYTHGYADTKKLIESGIFDAVMIEALGSMTAVTIPFQPIVTWWDTVAEANNVDLYVMHASSKACSTSTGWASPDQLTKQLVAARKFDTYTGSCFDSFNDLVRDPKGSTTALSKYFDNEETDDLILKELVITRPSKKTFTTTEPLVQFSGASAPLFELLLNSNAVQTDSTGMFALELELNPGTNTFKFEHKGKTVEYTITRDIDIIKDVSPIGSIAVDGQDKITVSVLAYNGSTVNAKLGSTTIALQVDDTATDNTDLNSDYKLYTGTFTVPAATNVMQSLGQITFSASWDTLSDSAKGATVTVNKKAELGSGRLVIVTAEAAETFPTGVINDYSDPNYFPLPKGTIDRVLGQEITYVEEGVTFKYYKLESGVRVYSKDISFITETKIPDNQITGLTVTADNNTTKVILDTKYKVPFKASYDGSKITFKFAYTTTVPASLRLTKNPLFSAANWSGTTLTLMLSSNGCFMGFKSYYNSADDLVLEFNNPALVQSSSNAYGYSLFGTRIALDSGHGGGNNPGAVGVHPSYPESTINQLITTYLKQELESIGATVYFIDSISTDPSLESRVQQAKKFNAHMMISIHQNSALSSKVTGSEAFYFNQYSKKLAENIASRIYSAVPTNNRGAKFGYFYVTRDTQFPATLVECGFISNSEEHYKLMQSSTQQALAKAITEGVIAFARATGGASSFAMGTESVGTGTSVPDDNNSSTSSTSSTSSGSQSLPSTSSNPSSDASNETSSTPTSSENTSSVDTSVPSVISPSSTTSFVNLNGASIKMPIQICLGEGANAIASAQVQFVEGMKDYKIYNEQKDVVVIGNMVYINIELFSKGTYKFKIVGKDSYGSVKFEQTITFAVI